MYFVLVLGLSTALYGLVAAVVCVFGFDVAPGALYDAARDPSVSSPEWFFAFVGWSVVAYPVLVAMHVALSWVAYQVRARRGTAYGVRVFRHGIRVLVAEVTNPFRGLVALRGASGVIDSTGLWFVYDWGHVIVHFVWALAFWVTFVAGFVAVAVA